MTGRMKSIAALLCAVLLLAAVPLAAQGKGGSKGKKPGSMPDWYPDVLNVWEAAGRGDITVREDPPGFGQPVLYPTPFGHGALHIQVDNPTDSRLLLGPDDFLHLTDEDAQDGFLFPPPRQARTHGFWKNWPNHFHSDFVSLWLQWINEDSILFGEGEPFGPVDIDNLDDLMRVGDSGDGLDQLRLQILATWLSIQSGYLPKTATIDPAAVPGAAEILGSLPYPLHVDPVDAPPVTVERGGIVGNIEELVFSGLLSKAETNALKDLLDAVNNGSSRALRRSSLIEDHQVWETLIAQLQDRSLHGRLEGDPAHRQPPGLADIWVCTEGLGLSQVVDTADFGVGGEILPDRMKEIARELKFGLVSVVNPAADPREGTDVVRLTVGNRVHTRSVDYDLTETAEEQFRRFIRELTRKTGLEAHLQVYHSPFGTDLVYAVVRSSRHWKLENVETAGPWPWFRSTSAWITEEAWATYGVQLQNLIWLHLEENPAVLVGKTPIHTQLPVTVEVRVTNVGRQPSGPVTVTDTVPRGLSVANVSPPPARMRESKSGTVLTWEIDGIAGSETDGIHFGETFTYDLSGAVTARTVTPGATAEWDGQTSRSVPTILVP